MNLDQVVSILLSSLSCREPELFSELCTPNSCHEPIGREDLMGGEIVGFVSGSFGAKWTTQ